MMGKINIFVLIILLATLAHAGPGDQFTTEEEEILTARIIMPTQEITKQESYHLFVEMSIEEGWHINSNQPLEDFLIPTKIKFDETEGIAFGKIRYMEPELRKFSFSGTKMSVYEGKVYALTTITIFPDFNIDELKISGNVYYQACNDESCLAPTQNYFAALLPVREFGTTVSKINQDIFKEGLNYIQFFEKEYETKR